MAIGPIISRYSLVVLFPVLTASAIYADYSHTQKYKALKALEKGEK